MTEKFEHEGSWWLPDRPEKQIRGTLKFDQEEGGTLNLEESFQSFEDVGETVELKFELIKAEIILGILSDSEHITLYSCESYTPQLFPPTFYVDSILIGAHFQKPLEIKFKSTSIKYAYLDQWSLSFLPESTKVISKPIPVNINNDFKICISVPYQSNNKLIGKLETYVKNNINIEVESSAEKPLNEYR